MAVAERAREASHGLALATRAEKDRALLAMADALIERSAEVLAGNAEDVERAEAAGTPANIVDRLRLTPDRLEAMAQGLRDVAGLPDPVGEVVRGSTPRQRAGAAPGAGAVRRGRDDLRGPPQRHRRRRRHLPEVRQRGAAARQLQRPLQQRRDRRRAARRGRRRRARPRRRPAGARRHPRQREGADARPRPRRRADPARGSGADPLGRRGVHGAGHRDRRRQLPRVRRPRRRPRQGARDRPERQDPPHQRLQRRRVAPGARRRRRRRSCRGS